ncbi:hypothetical protein RI367_008459 [Sorochytrium milnesiophthora]
MNLKLLNRVAQVAAMLLLALLTLAVSPSWQQIFREPQTQQQQQHRRHDYKMSFKKPYYFNNETDTLPHFQIAGNYIRLAPSVPFQAGLVNADTATSYKEWEVEIQMLVYGRSIVGSNGFAFWYTKDKQQLGHIVGGADQWTGLGILFETNDPSNQRPTAKISGVMNHGNQFKDTASEQSMVVGKIRNTNHAAMIRVTYTNQDKLELSMDTTSGNGAAWAVCFTATNVKLPAGYYFGVSASTAETPDDHDILSFETYEINPPAREHHKRPLEDQKIKAGQEFHLKEEAKEHFAEIEKKAQEMLQKQETPAGQTSAGIPETLTTELIQFVRATQLQILEKLNTMDPSHPVKASGSTDGTGAAGVQGLNARIDELSRQMSVIAAELSELAELIGNKAAAAAGDSSHNVKEAVQSIQDKLHAIESRTSAQHQAFTEQMNKNAATQVPLGSSEHSMFRTLFYFVMAQLVLLTLYGTWRRRTSDPEKKFI